MQNNIESIKIYKKSLTIYAKQFRIYKKGDRKNG